MPRDSAASNLLVVRVKSGFPSQTRAIGSIVWWAFRYFQIARPTTRTGLANEAAASACDTARAGTADCRAARDIVERGATLLHYRVTVIASEPNFS
jgi:hypothetical protein